MRSRSETAFLREREITYRSRAFQAGIRDQPQLQLPPQAQGLSAFSGAEGSIG